MADQYEEYNYDDKYHAESSSRKGKSKKDVRKEDSIAKPKPGAERKVVGTIANSEQKRKEEHKEK